ncbi:hypothetical protein BsWGS_17027 [Bradybaena similaris]
MATSPSPSLNDIPLSPPRSATSRPAHPLPMSVPRKKVVHSGSTSLSDGETCARRQSMSSVPPTTQTDVFYTIPLTPLPHSPQQTFSATPQMTPRSPVFSPVSATKQSPPIRPPASPAGVSEQTQHTSIADTPKVTIEMRRRKLPMSKQMVSDEAYAATQSIRTLPSVKAKSESRFMESSTLGAQRPASSDSQYPSTPQSGTSSYSTGSDNVFLNNSDLATKPVKSDCDSVEYETASAYYNTRPVSDHIYENLPQPKASFFNSWTEMSPEFPPPPPLPKRPPKKAPAVDPKPDYLHSHNPFAKSGPPDPFVGSGAVVGLTKKTFKKFIRDLDAAFVMFYNPRDKKCCGARATMRQAAHTTQKENHAFAAVDCTQECELCMTEKVRTYPTMKLYVKGLTVDTYEYVPLLTREIRSYVENAPIVREVALDKHRCILQ